MRGGQAFYCLGVDYMHPGLFYIGKVLPTANKTPRREHFSVMPSGYHFRQQVCFGRLSNLCVNKLASTRMPDSSRICMLTILDP